MVRRRRTTVKRKRNVKRARRSKRSGFNSVGSAMIPPQFYTKLRYTERVVLTPTLGAQSVHLWRGNSPFDPDFTGTGISAIGFGTFANMYAKYRVFASKIKLRAVLGSATPGEGAFEMALIPANNGFTTTPTPEAIKMNPRGKFRLVGNTGGGSMGSLSHFSTTAGIQGVKRLATKIRDSDSSAVTTNPADPWYWIVALQPSDHVSDMSIQLYVDIVYYVKFEDRRPFNIGV